MSEIDGMAKAVTTSVLGTVALLAAVVWPLLMWISWTAEWRDLRVIALGVVSATCLWIVHRKPKDTPNDH